MAHFYTLPGRRISHFESIEGALKFVEARPHMAKLIFLHTGRHTPEPLVIGSGVQIIGASAGTELDVMRAVIIENQKDTAVSFVDGSLSAYLGYCMTMFNPDRVCLILLIIINISTILFAPFKISTTPHINHYALQVLNFNFIRISRLKLRKIQK
jgi:hypothetical protein